MLQQRGRRQYRVDASRRSLKVQNLSKYWIRFYQPQMGKTCGIEADLIGGAAAAVLETLDCVCHRLSKSFTVANTNRKQQYDQQIVKKIKGISQLQMSKDASRPPI